MQYKKTNMIPLFEEFCRKNQVDGKELTVYISGHPVKVKVAANEDTRRQGFMNQDEPSGDNGILFVYEHDHILRFWMKDVNFPLDIVFFDSNMEEVDRQTMNAYKGESDLQLKIYMSHKPARYAIELPSGWCEKNLKQKGKLKI